MVTVERSYPTRHSLTRKSSFFKPLIVDDDDEPGSETPGGSEELAGQANNEPAALAQINLSPTEGQPATEVTQPAAEQEL
jgi:hypothetical protein